MYTSTRSTLSPPCLMHVCCSIAAPCKDQFFSGFSCVWENISRNNTAFAENFSPKRGERLYLEFSFLCEWNLRYGCRCCLWCWHAACYHMPLQGCADSGLCKLPKGNCSSLMRQAFCQWYDATAAWKRLQKGETFTVFTYDSQPSFLSWKYFHSVYDKIFQCLWFLFCTSQDKGLQLISIYALLQLSMVVNNIQFHQIFCSSSLHHCATASCCRNESYEESCVLWVFIIMQYQ